jgi:outer membrane protein assembly factor BamA
VYLRGYPINEFRGRNAALASLEYRFPIKNIERGISNTPVFLRRFHGALFAEAGNAWDDSFHIREFKSSVGAEARLDMYLAYYLPITLRIGVAQGLDEKRDTRFIFNIWTPVSY